MKLVKLDDGTKISSISRVINDDNTSPKDIEQSDTAEAIKEEENPSQPEEPEEPQEQV